MIWNKKKQQHIFHTVEPIQICPQKVVVTREKQLASTRAELSGAPPSCRERWRPVQTAYRGCSSRPGWGWRAWRRAPCWVSGGPPPSPAPCPAPWPGAGSSCLGSGAPSHHRTLQPLQVVEEEAGEQKKRRKMLWQKYWFNSLTQVKVRK